VNLDVFEVARLAFEWGVELASLESATLRADKQR